MSEETLQEKQEISLSDMELLEDGKIKFQTPDGKEVIGTPEDLEKGLFSFGTEIPTSELLHKAGGKFKDPCIRAINEYTARAENRSFLLSITHLKYVYEHEEYLSNSSRSVTDTPAASIVPESMEMSDTLFRNAISDEQRKLIRRLANFIETEIVDATNQSIHALELTRMQDTTTYTIHIKTGETSGYSFILGV